MVNYKFLPNRPFYNYTTPYVTWKDGFNNQDIENIISLCDPLLKEDAVVGYNAEVNFNIRKSTVSWLYPNNDTMWIFDKIAYIARELNSEFYNFDIYGFLEPMQYTIYESGSDGFYDWHMDQSTKSNLPRKFSLVLQLSDPEDYEGGELQIYNGSNDSISIEKIKGFVVGFPSFTWHRVTPVTKGTRKTLVVWISGPSFK